MNLTTHSFKASTAIAFAVVLGLCTVAPHAEAQYSMQIQAKIPFAFHIGKEVMPAGDYLITQVGTTNLMLDNRKFGTRVIFASVLRDDKKISDAAGSVRFHQYGNTYFLSGMTVPDSALGYKCVASKQEKEMSRLNGVDRGVQVAINTAPSEQR